VIGALEVALVAPFVTHTPSHLPPRAVLAVLALGALGTGLAYTLQHALIRTAGATVTSTVAYGIPLVSIALGVVVLGEDLAWNAPIGAAIIIAGAVLSRAASRPATPARPRRAPTAVPSASASLVPSWPRGPS